MSVEYEKTITEIKENLEKAKNMKFRAEAKLEQLYKQREEITNEIKAMGIEPENIDAEISKLQTEIDAMLKETKDLLPENLI